ncbi:transferase [Acuticoccus sediminis]|uniref:Transferase n=1 Tax=Acuticoccus sediminis TaxID=2184697 RepID=A0A8B2NKB3_9HYPH|nr:acetyltransferase [Acuticoccus sediminis]RAH96572.1 transferase [Acuticoccus sediminis]
MTDTTGTTDVVLFGTGQVSDVITVYLERYSDLNIVAYTVDAKFLPESGTFNGKPAVPWEEIEAHYAPGTVSLLGPLTYKGLNTVRRDRYLEGKARGYSFASFIHPDCHINTDRIGEHCIILESNIIQPFASIGNNVIIWSGNHIGHHVSVGDHTFIASQVGIAGSTSIGAECYLGGQAGIVHGITIGDRCVVLNAAVVKANLPDDSVVAGEAAPIKPFPSKRIAHLL